jgi:hypothetical protein
MASERPWRRLATDQADILTEELLAPGPGQYSAHAVVARGFLDGVCTGVALAQLNPEAALAIVREITAELEPSNTGRDFRQIYLGFADRMLGQ